MNKQLSKYIKLLRTTKEKQGRGCYHNPQTGEFCALGVGLKKVGYFSSENSSISTCVRNLGLSVMQASDIIGWNDEENLLFTEIADRLEKSA